METSKLNEWVQIITSIAVIAGLVLVAYEIRQNSDVTRAQMTQSRADTAIFLAAEWANSDYLPAIYEKVGLGEDLTRQEIMRYRTFVRAFLRNHQNNYLQYTQGFLGDYISRSTAMAVRSIISNTHARKYWDDNKFRLGAGKNMCFRRIS